MTTAPQTVDQYLAGVASDDARALLQRVRTIIREEAPEAQEVISYGMPGYKLHGYLVGFAAFKNHCSLFPGGRVAEFADLVKGFKTAKGTIQFTVDKPLPESAVRTIVKALVADNLAKRKP
jgi:uncharacterized protein YdhG (YjbR/CyaY superfamily)